MRRSRLTVRRTVTVRARVQLRRTFQTRLLPTTVPVMQHSITTTHHQHPVRILPSVLADEGYGAIEDPNREFDVFVSYAGEDAEFVRALVGALEAQNLQVWFAETAIGIGDSLRASIDRGLVRSRFGIVVLSPSFLKKPWPNYELNGLIAREMQGKKVVLPVWHPELSYDALMAYSPSLADKKALQGSSMPIEEIASALVELILPSE